MNSIRRSVACLSLMSAVHALPVAAAELETIVVTAQKREQSLYEVPMSVSAVTAEALHSSGVQTVADLATVVPSLVVASNSGSSLVATSLVTRGIGVNGSIPYFEPSTALFIDGAYRSRSALGLDDLVNVDRVEYLRGPQPTLYGRNASAGVLSVYTARPRENFGGSIESTLYAEDAGRDPFGWRVKGEASGPLSDSVGAGVSFTVHEQDDLFTVTGSPSIDSVNGKSEYTVRGQVEFEPSERFNLRLTGGRSDRDHNGPATELLFAEQSFDTLFPLLESFNDGLRARQGGADLGAANATFDQLLALGAVPTAPGVSVTPARNSMWDREIHLNGPKHNTLSGDDVTAQLQYEFASGITLDAVSGYNDYRSAEQQDIDQLTLPIGMFEQIQWGHAFSQEIRFASRTGEGSLDWILGAFYLRDSLDRTVEFQLGPDAPLLALGLNGDRGSFVGALDTESISVFGQVNWRAGDRLDFGVGLRWIDETKEGTMLNSSYNGSGAASPVFLAGPFARIFDPNDSGAARRGTDAFTYSLNANYQLTDGVILYGTHSRGFKSGGFNVVWGPTGPGEEGFEYADETVQAFEAGLKGTALSGALQFSTSLFHQRHEDYQTAAFIGTIFSLSNAEEASTQGVEFDVSWALSDSWRVWANGTVVDAKYEKFTRAPCSAVDVPNAQGYCDQSGGRLPFVSDWQVNLGGEYSTPLPLGTLRVRADLAVVDDYNPDLVVSSFLAQEGYEKLNLRTSWETPGFELSVFVHNATNARIVDWAGATNLVPGASGQFVIQAARTYGVMGRVRF